MKTVIFPPPSTENGLKNPNFVFPEFFRESSSFPSHAKLREKQKDEQILGYPRPE